MFTKKQKLFLFGFLILAILGGFAFWIFAPMETQEGLRGILPQTRIAQEKAKMSPEVPLEVDVKKRYGEWQKAAKKKVKKFPLPVTQVYRPVALAQGEKPAKPKRIVELEEELKKRPKNEKAIDTLKFIQREFSPRNER